MTDPTFYAEVHDIDPEELPAGFVPDGVRPTHAGRIDRYELSVDVDGNPLAVGPATARWWMVGDVE